MTSPDVIVIGAGVAGLRAAVDLSARGARVRVLEAKAVLGGRATSFTDPQTGERGGQRTARAAWLLSRNIQVPGDDRHGRSGAAAAQSGRGVRRSRRRAKPPAVPVAARADESAGGLAGMGRRCGWSRSAWRPLRMAKMPPRLPYETVEQWLIHNGQTARLREMLWEPLALAALNQSVREAAAPPFARVLADMFGGEPRDAALGLPSVPLDELFAEPARRFVEARGGEVRIGAAAKVVLHGGSAAGPLEVRRAASACTPAPSSAPCPGTRFPICLPATRANRRRAARAAATRPRRSRRVNLWLDRQILQTPFLGLPGRSMQWVFDKQQLFEGTSHLTMVSSGAEEVMGISNEALTQEALSELREALPESRAGARAAGHAWSGSGAPRFPWRRASHRGRRAGRNRRLVSRRGLDRDRAARYDRRRGHQRPDGGRGPFMNSVVVHYQEIALKGRNRPWFIARLVRNLKNATSDLDVRQVVSRMGRIEIVLGSAEAWAPVAERVRHTFGVANFSRAGRAPLDMDAIAAAILKDLGDMQTSTFRVSAKRADKRFPLTSPQIEREVGGRIKEAADGRWISAIPSSRFTSTRSPERRFTTSARRRDRAACPPA